ncbi:MAG: CHAT domain-containing protein [Oscillatoria princeps RMCB-10]|jgi:CHAT domain-containing protein|nr:CHAT domain-containing protein [Oscillatoria princeps RMCB-10]
MKLFKFSVNFSLALLLILLSARPALNQTGNQSDGFPNVPDTTTVITEPESPAPPEPLSATPPVSGETPNTAKTNAAQTSDPTDSVSGTAETSGTAGTSGGSEVDRAGFEAIVRAGETGEAVQTVEEAQAVEFSAQLAIRLYGKAPTIDEIGKALFTLYQATGKKAVITYIIALENRLDSLTIFPQNPGTLTEGVNDPSIRKVVPVARKTVNKVAREFRQEVTNPVKSATTSYLKSAQQLYQWIVSPIEPELQANKVDIVVFVMDSGLRSMPLAALHDGKQFLIEKYGVALIPSFGLTDTRYVDLRNSQVLAMGASEFKDQNPLPAVPVELSEIMSGAWRGQRFLNEQFTLENFKVLNRQQHFNIIHLATHGEFRTGELSNSYIQFWNKKVNMLELRRLSQELGWNAANTAPVELLVMSACRTALGDEQAELGFAGLTVNAGVKSALASLWYISDAGTLALMNEFYTQLSVTGNKAEALRQAQLAMLRGQVQLEGGQLRGSDRQVIPLPREIAAQGKIKVSHPYFWSAFTLIGNWN